MSVFLQLLPVTQAQAVATIEAIEAGLARMVRVVVVLTAEAIGTNKHASSTSRTAPHTGIHRDRMLAIENEIPTVGVVGIGAETVKDLRMAIEHVLYLKGQDETVA